MLSLRGFSANIYFQAIKQAKRNHWNNFLEKEDPQSIFKALNYTKDYTEQHGVIADTAGS
jgi:hypothetical protein